MSRPCSCDLQAAQWYADICADEQCLIQDGGKNAEHFTHVKDYFISRCKKVDCGLKNMSKAAVQRLVLEKCAERHGVTAGEKWFTWFVLMGECPFTSDNVANEEKQIQSEDLPDDL